MVITKAKYN